MDRLVFLALTLGGADALALSCASAPALRTAHSRRAVSFMQEQDVPGDVEDLTLDAAPIASSSFFDDDDVDEGSVAKEALKAETSAGVAGPRPDKAVMGEILLALEARNPTPSPATSPLLNGKWKVLYATGASPGLKALTLLLKGAKQAPKSPSGADLVDVQDSYVTIKADQPRVESSTSLRVLSIENTATLSSRLEAESAVRLLETYESAESQWPTSLKLPFGSSPLEYSRSLLVSYLDEELLVLRDAAGRPDVLLRIADAMPDPVPAPSVEVVPEPSVEVVTTDDEPAAVDPTDDVAPGAS